MTTLNKNTFLHCAMLSFAATTSSIALATDSDNDWGGLYGGIAIGALHGKANPDTTVTERNYFDTENINKLNSTFQKEVSGSSATASAILGYLKQSDHFLYGIEADLTAMNFNEKTSTTTSYANRVDENTTDTSIKSSLSLAIRPTIGYSYGNTMVQFGAGPVISRFNYKFQFSDFNDATTRSDNDKTAIGVSANIGIKHKLDSGLILQGDYIYSQYSNIADKDSLLTNNAGATQTDKFSYDSDFKSHNVRIGLVKYF